MTWDPTCGHFCQMFFFNSRTMAPSKAERATCWANRDAFWDCMEKNGNDCSKCKGPRAEYENSCSKSWVRICIIIICSHTTFRMAALLQIAHQRQMSLMIIFDFLFRIQINVSDVCNLGEQNFFIVYLPFQSSFDQYIFRNIFIPMAGYNKSISEYEKIISSPLISFYSP